MKTIFLTIAMALFAVEDPKPKSDLDKFQGVWELASMEMEPGKPLPAEAFKGTTNELIGQKFVFKSAEGVYKGTFEIDAGKSPKTMDITFTDGPNKGAKMLGIYEFKSDSWRICLTPEGKPRPREFAANTDTGAILETFTRPLSAEAKKDMAKLEGEWSMVSGEIDGQPMPPPMVSTAKRIAKAGETSVVIGGNVFMKAKFTVDPSKKPATIDYDVIEGTTKGKTQLGIYMFDGDDKVKFCFSAPGKDRPADFSTKAGSSRTMSVWKREKK